MNLHNVETVISNIDDKFVCEAYEYVKLRNNTAYRVMKKISAIAACFAAFVVLSFSTVTIATAAGNIAAYDILYSVYPELAKNLTPVNVSCVDNGIKMEVESVYINGDTAEIYISMKDLEGDRIDETIDLFDSYSIHSSGDSIGNCTRVGYDADEKEATFLIKVQQMNGKKIDDKKIIFSVSEFLSGKQDFEEKLSEISLENVEPVYILQENVEIRGWSGANKTGVSQKALSGYLTRNESQSFSPVLGVTITAYGFVDSRLRMQVHYENILNTDNHGCVYLKDSEGNEIQSEFSVAFWDEEHTGSYEEYIFDVGPEADLTGYSVWGWFKTCKNLTEGDWEVSFTVDEK